MVDPAAIAKIRENLQTILVEHPSINSTVYNDQILGNAILHSLLALAATFPINPTDSISNQAIEENHRVVVSTGYQFDLRTLIDWHNTRELMDGERKDKLKELRNPITHEVSPDHDFLYIRVVAADRSIMFLQNVESDLDGITLLTKQQKLHPFLLEIDRLSSNTVFKQGRL